MQYMEPRQIIGPIGYKQPVITMYFVNLISNSKGKPNTISDVNAQQNLTLKINEKSMADKAQKSGNIVILSSWKFHL